VGHVTNSQLHDMTGKVTHRDRSVEIPTLGPEGTRRLTSLECR
jgi:hypothetical protein